MSWAKVDDQWWMHPKVLPLPMAARGLWTTALSYCGQRQSPHVPAAWVDMVAGDEGRNLAASLVTVGLWSEHDDGWEIHDWSEYQADTKSESKQNAGRIGGLTRALQAATERAEAAEAALNAESGESKQTASTQQAQSKQPSKQPPKHGPEPEPVPEDQPPCVADAPREDVEDLYDAVVAECYAEPPAPGSTARQAATAATRRLAAQGATTDQVPARARVLRGWWGTKAVTPHALDKHWPRLVRESKPPPDPVDEQTRSRERRDAGLRAAGLLPDGATS